MSDSDKGGLSAFRRRRFLKGLAGTSGVALATGYTGQEDAGPTETDTPSSSVGNGSEGGGQEQVQTFVYAETDTARTLDPHAVDPSNTTSVFAFPENAYETLVYFPPDNAQELTPELASEVPSEDLISDDLTTIEFPLREGVTFHTGEEMTAEDVRYSWERAMTMNVSPDAPPFRNSIDSMEVVDDYTFRVTLAQPIAPTFLIASVTRPIAAVVSKQAVEENGGVQEGQANRWMSTNSAGTGPYRAGRFDQGNELVWEPHEDYWDPDSVTVKRLRQVAAPEFATRRAMLQRGEAHSILAAADFFSELEGAEGIKTSFFPSFDPTHISFNFEIPYGTEAIAGIGAEDDTVPPDFFQDPDVRKGFAYAFDYQTYIDQVWSGNMSRMSVYHFPNMFGFDDSAPIFEHSPEQAEEHFRNAGYWEEGFRVTSHNEILPQFTNGNLILKDSIEALNDRFTINVVEEPEANAVERHAQGGWPIEFHGFLPQGPDPDAYYRALMHEDGSVASVTSSYKYMGDEIINHIDNARQEADQDTRREIYAELQQLCFDNPAVIPVGVEEAMITTQPCVEVVENPAWSAAHFKYYDISNC